MAVGVGDRVVTERIFHGREKHEETFSSDFKSPWNHGAICFLVIL